MDVAADPLARLAAEQRVDGLAAVLAGDVPERDVDRAERAADGRAHEMGVPVEVLPVVLDPEGVLADQVAGPDVDDPLGRLRVAPDARLADADDPAVGRDPHEVPAAGQNALDGLDLHRGASSYRPVSPVSAMPRTK